MASGDKTDETAKPVRTTRRNRSEADAREGNVGDALRIVYQSTISEDIPEDLLALLGKLD